MRKPLFILTTLSCFLLPVLLNAQITVTPAATAAALAAKLTGPGVIVIAPTLTCASNANGIFSGTSSLSFDSGIVLTSGQAPQFYRRAPAAPLASTMLRACRQVR